MIGGHAIADRRIRDRRPAKPVVDPWRAHGTAVDDERRPTGAIERAVTVFLAGSECPFTCSFCDLWRWTTDGPTPSGALPAQLQQALASLDPPLTHNTPHRLKLYNASNFFDSRAVPVSDWPAIAALSQPFAGVTVESHASTIAPRVLDFARQLDGRLEVAIGLETIHPEGMRHLNKRLDVDRFDHAAEFLAEHDIDLRVFVLLGAPFVPANESVEWAIRTAEHAARRGAAMVALIPVRGGNGELEHLAADGHFTAPTLHDLEQALDGCLSFAPSVVTVDLWDVACLPACDACRDARVARLGRINCTGRGEPAVACDSCA